MCYKTLIERYVKTHILIPILACMVFSPSCEMFADAATVQSFFSPSGKYKVVFTEMEHKRFENQTVQSVDDVNHIVYHIDIFDRQRNALVISTSYTDVYGWGEQKPTPVKGIFYWIMWSPNEDFIILPVEGWASAPGTENRTALAINPVLPWKTAIVAFDEFFWIDDFSGVSSQHNDCQYEVIKFDGITGNTVAIKGSDSPIGYELVSVHKNKRKIMIRQVLDNCRDMEQLKQPSCFWYDLQTQKESSRLPCR